MEAPICDEGGQRQFKVGKNLKQQQQQGGPRRSKSGQLRLVFVMSGGVIMLVTVVVVLSALISPSVGLAGGVRVAARAAANKGDSRGTAADGGAALATSETAASSFEAARRQQVEPRSSGGNAAGQSISGLGGKVSDGDPLWVPLVHATDRRGESDDSNGQSAQILKKFGPQAPASGPFEQVDSADLPAEFRGDDSFEAEQQFAEAPREQSKLAKLCEQTSSVLASVLPAPFGGHKRSILCQFFGQVPMNPAAGGKKNAIRSKEQATMESVAVIHPLDQTQQHHQQQQQQPIMLMRPMKHPIELLIEHQRQQSQLAARAQQQPLAQQDLKGAASVLDYSYQQRLEAPSSMQRQQSTRKSKGQERFSQQVKVSPSPLLSTSGWRIFENIPEQTQQSNQTSSASLGGQSTQAPAAPASVSSSSLKGSSKTSREGQTDGANQHSSSKPTNHSSAASSVNETVSTARPTSTRQTPSTTSTTTTTTTTTISTPQKLNLTREKLGAAQLLVLGRPPTYDAGEGRGQTTVAKRSEASMFSSTRKPKEQPVESRTIEVTAQSNNGGSPHQSAHTSASATANATASPNSSANQKPSAGNQLHNREELVIASINNLTRIAFGNQLRDTFKVINKLIGQQAGLFASQTAPKSESDSLMSSESQKVPKKATNGLAPPDSKKKTKSREKEILSSTRSKISTPVPKTAKRTTPSSAKKEIDTDSQQQKHPSRQHLSSTTKPSKLTAHSSLSSGEHKQAERKSTISSLESGRIPSSGGNLRTVSRSLSLDPIRRTTPFRPLTPFESSWQTTLVDDIRRDRTTRSKPNRDASTRSGAQNHQQATVTQYPWLIPDDASTDLFGYTWPAQTNRVSTRRKTQPTSTSTTTKRWIPKATDNLIATGMTKKQALVLNRLDSKSTAKMDSLTTLRMSLDQSSAAGPTSSLAPSTLGPQSSTTSMGNTQSRWIPTLGQSRHKSGQQTTVSSRQETAISSTTPMPKIQTTKVDSTKAAEANDLMEARASDSISKFTTTHWNEANEMLATTRRLYQQPQPQIAQTGEFFNAETISTWPERYQTMLENSLRSTAAMQTTRRNGETYATSEMDNTIQPTTTTTTTTTANTRLARHKYETTTPLGGQQASQTTRRMDVDSGSFTVLPANHKLSASYTDEPQTTANTQPPKQTTQPIDTEQQSTNKQSNQTVSLRPPYTNLQQPQQPASAESALSQELSQNASSPATRRAIYEEMFRLPQTGKNFVGAHSSLAHQGLNLSALRLLSQGLFATLATTDSPPEPTNRSLFSPPVEQLIGANSQYKAGESEPLNNSDRLLEMLGAQNASLSMLPMSQYELLLNGTSQSWDSAEQLDEMSNKSNSSSKWLLGRASNLLNDLKQLEQRKAAALLAAIRYQIPGPLVRPWDLNSDLQQTASDRLDGADGQLAASVGGEAAQDYLRTSLWMSRASEAVRSALAKQRLVPRNELEARLSGRRIDDQSISDRRSDSPIDDPENTFVLIDGNRTKKQDASYVFVAGNSSSPNEDDNSLRTILLDRDSSRRDNRHKGEEDISEELKSTEQQKRGRPGQQNPKYIHFSDYKTSWTRPADPHLRFPGQLSSSAAIAARLRDSTQSRKAITQPAIDIERAKQLDKEAEGQSFDCADKSAGFHPDANTNCQTFYHCSNTGHLLTFKCPQQTRFDERSLKCGPWFEVNCDLGRAKVRQNPLAVK